MKMHRSLAFILAIATSASCHHLSTDELVDGISGFFEIDHDLHAPGQHDDWYGVEIIWNQNKGAFTWQNRAGVTWTLTPMMGSSGSWDETKLAVGNDSPYRNDGFEFARIEWVSSALLLHFQCDCSYNNETQAMPIRNLISPPCSL